MRTRSSLRSPTRVESIPKEAVWPAALERSLVRRPRMNALEKRHQLRSARVQSGALRGGFDREAHLDVRSAELVAGEPFTLGELAFHEVQLSLQVGLNQRRLHLRRDAARDWPRKERHRRLLDPVEDKLEQQ